MIHERSVYITLELSKEFAMAVTLLRSRSRMAALVAGFCLLVMLMVSNIAPAVAGPAFSVEKYYYSDASMTATSGRPMT